MVTLHDMTTRELMNALRLARDCYDDDPVHVGSRFVEGGKLVGVWATLDEIRYVLNNRPHIPSKKEAQVIRQLKAKTKQSEEWLRAHPKYGQEIANACTPDRRVVDAQTYQRMAKLYGGVVSHLYKIGEPNV